MQCWCRVGLSWSLIPSNLKVVHSTMYDDHQCHSLPHRLLATNALHHWVLTSRSLAIFCLFSFFHMLDSLSSFLHTAFFLLEAEPIRVWTEIPKMSGSKANSTSGLRLNDLKCVRDSGVCDKLRISHSWSLGKRGAQKEAMVNHLHSKYSPQDHS